MAEKGAREQIILLTYRRKKRDGIRIKGMDRRKKTFWVEKWDSFAKLEALRKVSASGGMDFSKLLFLNLMEIVIRTHRSVNIFHQRSVNVC